MMWLQDAQIIVEQRQRIVRVAEKGGGASRMVDIVCGSRNQRDGLISAVHAHILGSKQSKKTARGLLMEKDICIYFTNNGL